MCVVRVRWEERETLLPKTNAIKLLYGQALCQISSEIKDTFELVIQEQGRKHLQPRLFLILYLCSSDALWIK